MNTNVIKSNNITNDMLEKINAMTKSQMKADDVYVFSLVLCDNEIDRDGECFDANAIEKLADLFIGKTGIFDHSMKSGDQTARIFDCFAEYPSSMLTSYGDKYVRLRAWAYMPRIAKNSELIEEIEAGIKKEVSISCSVSKSICSICGEDTYKSHCGHIRGKVYENSECYYVLSEPTDAYEWSFVAVPAQRNAGVTKSYSPKLDKESIDDIICKKGMENIKEYIKELEKKAKNADVLREKTRKSISGIIAVKCEDFSVKTLSKIMDVLDDEELCAFQKLFESRESIKPQLCAINRQDDEDKSYII